VPPVAVGTHWSVRTLARHLGVSASIVHAVLAAEDIKPHRVRYWKTSHDPEFEPKMLAIVGLYLHPPENAVVLSVDEKTSIQALDRTQPLLPLKPHLIERRSFEYKRNGTASLLAALEAHTGRVQGEAIRKNDSPTFIKFLRKLLAAHPGKDLYVIVDNGSSHRSKQTRVGLPPQALAPVFHSDACELAQSDRDLVRHPHSLGGPPRHFRLPRRFGGQAHGVYPCVQGSRSAFRLDLYRQPARRMIRQRISETGH